MEVERRKFVVFDVESSNEAPPRGIVRPFLVVVDDGERRRVVRVGREKKEA